MAGESRRPQGRWAHIYAGNETVMGIADELKEAGRNTILEQAAAARLAGEEDT